MTRKPLSTKQLRVLEAACVGFIDKYEVSCEGSAYQVDRVNEAAPELLIAVGKIVGFHEYADSG